MGGGIDWKLFSQKSIGGYLIDLTQTTFNKILLGSTPSKFNVSNRQLFAVIIKTSLSARMIVSRAAITLANQFSSQPTPNEDNLNLETFQIGCRLDIANSYNELTAQI